MILYFNEHGQLLEYLEYDSVARVGSTDFRLFAYFEGDLGDSVIATIRFRRPDLEGNEYPDLFMMPEDLYYKASVQESAYFRQGNNPYSGFVFDFNDVFDNGKKVRILDTPGKWEATITLYENDIDSSANVVGIIEFNVEPAVSAYDDEAEDIGAGAVVYNILQLLQRLTVEDFVPYVGSVKDTDLGQFKLLTDVIQAHENNDLNLVTDKNIIFVVPYQKDGETELMYYQFPAPGAGEELSPLDIATRQWVQAWGQEKLVFATDQEVDDLFS